MRVATVDAFIVPELEGENLPYVELQDDNIAAVAEDVLSKVPFIISGHNCLPFSGSDYSNDIGEHGYSIVRPGPSHRRSFEIHHPLTPDVITDEYGNKYGSLILKGANASNSYMYMQADMPDNLAFNGLLTSSTVGRVARASEVLRANGVTNAEYLIGVSEPKAMPYKTNEHYDGDFELLLRGDFKTQLASTFWQGIGKLDFKPEGVRDYLGIDGLGRLHAALGRTAFFVALRAHSTPYRLRDFAFRSYADEFKHLFEQEGGIEKYLTEDLPNALGRNLGLMKKLGLVQTYVTDHNVSIDGSIVDLDSVRGPILGLGDEMPSEEDFLADLANALNIGPGLIFGAMRFLEGGDHSVADYLKCLPLYIESLTNSYIEAAELADTDNEYLESIKRLLTEVGDIEDNDQLSQIQTKIIRTYFEEDDFKEKERSIHETAVSMVVDPVERFELFDAILCQLFEQSGSIVNPLISDNLFNHKPRTPTYDFDVETKLKDSLNDPSSLVQEHLRYTVYKHLREAILEKVDDVDNEFILKMFNEAILEAINQVFVRTNITRLSELAAKQLAQLLPPSDEITSAAVMETAFEDVIFHTSQHRDPDKLAEILQLEETVIEEFTEEENDGDGDELHTIEVSENHTPIELMVFSTIPEKNNDEEEEEAESIDDEPILEKEIFHSTSNRLENGTILMSMYKEEDAVCVLSYKDETGNLLYRVFASEERALEQVKKQSEYMKFTGVQSRLFIQ